MTRAVWTLLFLTVTGLAVGMELLAALDNSPQTVPWTDYLTAYVPPELLLALCGALLLWLPAHFWLRRRNYGRR